MKRLKELRKERQLTQQELGEIINCTHTAINYYENGKRQPDLETLCKLADYFNVSVDYLLGKPQWTDEEKALGVGNHKTVLSDEEWTWIETLENLKQKKGEDTVKTVIQLINTMAEK